MSSILFINRVHPPLEGATGQLLAELAPALARAGWQVTVLTAAPADAAPRTESIHGVTLVRVAGLPFTRSSHWRRALAYLSLYPALLWRAWRLPRAEVVVTLTDPPLLVILGGLLKWMKRTQSVHWAQDLYPELAEELGVLARGGVLATLLRWLSTRALRRCDAIIAVGRCMKKRLHRRGIDPNRIDVIPNWGHGAWSGAGGDPELNPFRHAHQLAGRFVVMYSGNFGMAHPFEAILDAAARMQSSHPRALFLLVGDGPRLPWVRQQAASRQLSNVRFLPYQPRARLAESLGAADVHLATMEENLCGLVVPSKVAGVLSAGRPCLFVGPPECEAACLIREQGFGEVLARPDGAELAARLGVWMERPDPMRWVNERAASVAPVVGLPAAVSAFAQVLSRAVQQGRDNPFEAQPTPDAALNFTAPVAPLPPNHVSPAHGMHSDSDPVHVEGTAPASSTPPECPAREAA